MGYKIITYLLTTTLYTFVLLYVDTCGFPVRFRTSFFDYANSICKTRIVGIDTVTSEMVRIIIDVIDIQTG